MRDGSQCSKIAQALRKGRSLTMLDIFRLCGSLNGHKRIDELRQRGFKIRASLIVTRKNKFVRCWYLAA